MALKGTIRLYVSALFWASPSFVGGTRGGLTSGREWRATRAAGLATVGRPAAAGPTKGVAQIGENLQQYCLRCRGVFLLTSISVNMGVSLNLETTPL